MNTMRSNRQSFQNPYLQPYSNNYNMYAPSRPIMRPEGHYNRPRSCNSNFSHDPKVMPMQAQGRGRGRIGASIFTTNSQHQRRDNYHQFRTPRNQYHKYDVGKKRIEKTPVCFQCKLNYSFNKHNRLPLILNCGHTFCKVCVLKQLQEGQIVCFECQRKTVLTKENSELYQANIDRLLMSNHFVLGLLGETQTNHSTDQLANLTFAKEKRKIKVSTDSLKNVCGFNKCPKEATSYCPNCDVSFCPDCSKLIHSSSKALMAHKPGVRQEFSLYLEICNTHPTMPMAFYCEDCRVNACCYCILAQHESHTKISFSQISDDEAKELTERLAEAKIMLKDIRTSQKRVTSLKNPDTTEIQNQIDRYFVDAHGKLETIQKRLQEQLQDMKIEDKALNRIQKTLNSSAEQLEHILKLDIDQASMGKNNINYRGAVDHLRKLSQVPRFLTFGETNVPLKFDSNTGVFDQLEKDLAIKICEDFNYSLEKDMPDGFSRDNESEFSESDSVSTEISSLALNPKRSKVRLIPKKPIDMEEVLVQQIDSIDQFYVQFKRDQCRIMQLNEEITNYVKLGAAENVVNFGLNNLYLAQCATESDQEVWCRARLTEIKTSEAGTEYLMFFIDIGKSQWIDQHQVKQISPVFMGKKPFATPCRLYNKMNVIWKESADVSFRNILNGKTVYILERGAADGIHEVELMISSLDGGCVSVTDLLVFTSDAIESDVRTDEFPSNAFDNSLKVFSSSVKFSKQQTEKVIIAHIVDAYNIFVHLVKDQEAFRNLCGDIKNKFKKAKTRGVNRLLPREGSSVLVEHKDIIRSNYHRGYVKRVDVNTRRSYVLLVDWGLNVVVDPHQLLPIDESFIKLESQAVLVKLAHIAPVGKQTEWSPESTALLQSYMAFKVVLKMVVHETKPNVEVILFDTSHMMETCLSALMVQKELAISTGPSSKQVIWEQLTKVVPKITKDAGLISSIIKDVENDQFDDPSDDDEASTLKKRRVEVVRIESPNKLWIKFLDRAEKEQQLFKALQIHYGTKPQTQDKWRVGDFCVIKVNNEFFRGKIFSLIEDEITVTRLDKGDDIITDKSALFIFNEYFHSFPQIVLKSHLAGIRPAGDTGTWSKTSVDLFQEILSTYDRFSAAMSTTTSELVEKSLPIYMWVGLVKCGGAIEPDRIKYIDINNLLVRVGLAFKIQQIPMPKRIKIDENPGRALLEAIVIDEVEETVEKMDVDKDDSAKDNKNQTEKTGAANILDDTKNVNCDVAESGVPKLAPACPKYEIDMKNWLIPFPLTKTEFQARVTCVETAGRLYLHDEDMEKAYQKMEANIIELFTTDPPEVTTKPWEPGHLCTINHEGKWYRGKVLDVKNRDTIRVYMIDFGSDHLVSSTSIYRDLVYTEIPPFATVVKLHSVYPKTGKWNTSSYDQFHDLISDWCRIVVQGPLNVEVPLVDVYNDDGVHVNERLIEMCPSLSKSSINPNEPIVIENEEEDLIEMNSDGKKYIDKLLPRQLVKGKKIPMAIHNIDNINSVSLVCPQMDNDFGDLMMDIQAEVNSLPGLADYDDYLPCLALYKDDDSVAWYRAEIVDTKYLDDSYIRVRFVDYGNYDDVKIENLKCISPKFMDLPQQSWRAALNIVPVVEDTDKIRQTLLNAVKFSKIYVKLVKATPLTVDLYNRQGQLVYQDLIDNCDLKKIFSE